MGEDLTNGFYSVKLLTPRELDKLTRDGEFKEYITSEASFRGVALHLVGLIQHSKKGVFFFDCGQGILQITYSVSNTFLKVGTSRFEQDVGSIKSFMFTLRLRTIQAYGGSEHVVKVITDHYCSCVVGLSSDIRDLAIRSIIQ